MYARNAADREFCEQQLQQHREGFKKDRAIYQSTK